MAEAERTEPFIPTGQSSASKPDVELMQSRTQADVETVQWADLDFSVKGKQILKNVSGHLKPGQLACVLGPSGAGKSTLLNVLAGRQRTSGDGFVLGGSIEIGDTIVTPEQMKKRVAFVMQDEALMPTATVRESLEFSAAMRLPGKSAADRAADIDTLLTSLGIEHCADTIIGSALVKGVSGGERKRASVGIELITGPSMVLLDEPTSGLDSYAASELVKELKRLAASGKVVCCTIHQPSSEVFAMFDHVMCLRQGEMYFDGPNAELLPILEGAGQPCPKGYNAADWLLLTAQTLGDEQVAKVRRQCESHVLKRGDSQVKDLRDKHGSSFQGAPPLAEVPRAPFGRQVACLIRREAQNFWRDKKSFGARMGMTMGQAILYALIFPGVAKSESHLRDLATDYTLCPACNPESVLFDSATCQAQWQGNVVGNLGNEFGAIVGLSIAAFFGSAQPLLLSFPLERPVFLREYSSNMYSVVAYFLAKTVVELGVTLGQNLILWLITFFVLGFRGGVVALILLIGSTWLMAVSAASMALWVGCIVSTPSSAVQLAPAISVPQILFSGLFLKSKDLPVYLRWIQYVCALKYAINLMCIVEFSDLEIQGPSASVDFGADFLSSQDIDKDQWWLYVIILLVIFAGFRTLALVALKQKGKYVF